MTKIDDRSNSDAINQRLLEDRRKENIKNADRAEFEKKLAMQKQLSKKANIKETAKNQVTKKIPKVPSVKTPVNKSLLKDKKVDKQNFSKNTPDIKAKERKEDTQKDNVKNTKTDKKRDDILLENAVKRKKEETSDGDPQNKGSDDFFQATVNIAMQPPIQTNEVQKSAAPTKIPDAVLQELVDRIFVGVDKKGLSQFVIELKEGVLGGGIINITAQKGQINLKFSGLNASSKTLVRNAKQELSARLRGKHLSLNTFEVA